MKYKKHIPIFFTVDDNYIDYISIALASLIDHSSKENKYEINIIYDKLSKHSKRLLRKFERKNVSIKFFSITLRMQSLGVKLDVRDYYTLTTYYRLLLPEMFPLIKKALYIDSDVVLLDDVANLYDTELGNSLVGAVPDHSVQIFDEFIKYVEEVIEVPHEKYFNAGVLVMNLAQMRKEKFQSQAFNLLKRVTFKVAQDQDVLNFLCKGKVTFINKRWNIMPLGEEQPGVNISLIHYNLILKPWKQDNIMYEHYFWHYAESINLKDKILEKKSHISEELKAKEKEGINKVKQLCLYEVSRKDSYYKKIYKGIKKMSYNFDDIEYKNVTPERREVLNRIIELEKQGKFDQDVENDPPYFFLEPNTVDYLQEKFISKVKSFYANSYSWKYFNHLIKKGRIVIDEYKGVKNLIGVDSGAIITCNHFSPFDSVPIHKIMKNCKKNTKLYKVIKEGNYSYPGLYGFFMRHCNTLPLASNLDVLKEFLTAVDTILKRGDFILIYPEQSMWWNYRKPKPLKVGAFKFAAKSNVPVIPTFITMRDTDKLDEDGLPIQAYTYHILPPIYPSKNKTVNQNAEDMMKINYDMWKRLYEKEYGIPLVYEEETKDDIVHNFDSVRDSHNNSTQRNI